jgi:hypothetical protein
MPIRCGDVDVPDAGTEITCEAATDGMIYMSAIDADGKGYQVVMGPREADALAANLIDKAAHVRRWRAGN